MGQNNKTSSRLAGIFALTVAAVAVAGAAVLVSLEGPDCQKKAHICAIPMPKV